jgi:hypothetical protein
VNNGTDYGGIVGGVGNTINTNVQNAIILGGTNVTATEANTTYIDNLNVSGIAFNTVNNVVIASNTASLDLSVGNTFKIAVPQTVNTHIIVSNIKEGQVSNIRFLQDAVAGGTVTFDTEFKFPGGVAPIITATSNSEDVLSCISYDGTSLLSNITQDYS